MVRTKAIEVVRRLVRASPALVPTTVLPFHEDVVARLVRSDNPVSAQSGVAILGHLMEHAIKTYTPPLLPRKDLSTKPNS